MNQRSPTFKVRARGPHACFTRPELRTERVSYEVMTPSAARGLLDAILWKPAMRWVPERIHVLAPIRFEAVRRNEVASKAPISGDVNRFFADEDRQQRSTLLLKNVDYVIEAHFEMTARAGPEDNVRKFQEMFERRLAKGQCFNTPYLGCREFAARVEAAPDVWDVPEALRERRRLGLMLQDLQFSEDGSAKPFFFDAILDHGRLDIPEATT